MYFCDESKSKTSSKGRSNARGIVLRKQCGRLVVVKEWCILVCGFVYDVGHRVVLVEVLEVPVVHLLLAGRGPCV
jgi:hypothetical protein